MLCLFLMMVFTLLWISKVSSPVMAYWAVTYYRNVLGSTKFDQINSEASMISWLTYSISDTLYPESLSSLPVGNLCFVEYYAGE